MIVLRNMAHAGDVVLSRNIIAEAVAANPKVKFKLQCYEQYAYLWEDLKLPIARVPRDKSPTDPGHPVINLWFAFFGDMLVNGLTYKSSWLTFNRQAKRIGINQVEWNDRQRFVHLPRPDIGRVHHPSVLVENGRVLSGQKVLDINQHLKRLGDTFHGTMFYCTGKIPDVQKRENLVSVADWNLKRISVLSERTNTMIVRLSAAMVSSFTKRNHGRLRLVFGDPLGCPIWDDDGVRYTKSFDQMVAFVRRFVG